jgi:hypothetical protein
MWFKNLVGFSEQDAEHVRANITVTGDSMVLTWMFSSSVTGDPSRVL